MNPIDSLRERNPGVGWAVYALDPLGPVTLEAHVDGAILSWQGSTLAECLDHAFPPAAAGGHDPAPDAATPVEREDSSATDVGPPSGAPPPLSDDLGVFG